MSRHYYGDEIIYEYKGFQYMPEDDVEEDNIKRFHHVNFNGQKLTWMPLSPYSSASKELFEQWVDMGRPTRYDIGGHHKEDHEKYYQKWVLEQLEKELDLEA